VVQEKRIVTSRERFSAVLGDRPRAKVLIEASTESEWVARHIESLNHEVIVADPNFAPMYAQRSRRIKTDKRDARTLAEALRLGAYRSAHRLSDKRRHIRAELAVREALVRTRTRYIALAKSLLRRDGYRVVSSMSRNTAQRISELPLSEPLSQELRPLLDILEPITMEIDAADFRITKLMAGDSAVELVATVPQVGPLTASAVVATVDDIGRFHSSEQFAAYLGLVPREKSSGEKLSRGRITKAGNSRCRSLLVEAALRIMRSKSDDTAALRNWASRIAARRGKKIATVALARRFATIIYAVWKSGKMYDSRKLRGLTQEAKAG
jgi:transposase